MKRGIAIAVITFGSIAFGPSGAAQSLGTGAGVLTVNGNRHEMKYARAAALPDVRDKGKEILRVMVADAPFPSEAMFDDFGMMRLGRDGKLHGVQMDFRGEGVVWLLRNSDSKVSFSQSLSPNPYPLKITGAKAQVAGSMTANQKAESDVEVTVEISLQYSAPIEKYVPEAEPTAADVEAARRSASATAYLSYEDAIQKGNRAGILAGLEPERRAKIDNDQFPEILKMVQSMEPKEVRVRKAVENNGAAKLWVTGKSAEGPQKGKILMRLDNGRWIVTDEQWEN